MDTYSANKEAPNTAIHRHNVAGRFSAALSRCDTLLSLGSDGFMYTF